jgi:hypothetical protein
MWKKEVVPIYRNQGPMNGGGLLLKQKIFWAVVKTFFANKSWLREK